AVDDLGELPGLVDLVQATSLTLGHEQPGGVRADVDTGAAHKQWRDPGSRLAQSTDPGRDSNCWHHRCVSECAIEVRGLRKLYGGFEAVRGIDFAVKRGEIFGLLGPNGAGKTTTVEILEGYRDRTAGEVSVLGYDPGQRPRALRARIGIVLQSTGLYRHIRVREA